MIFATIEIGSLAIGAWIAVQAPKEWDEVGVTLLRVAGMVVASILGATLAAGFWLWHGTDASYAQEWRAWAFSTGVGTLLVAPVLSAFRDFRVKRSGGLPAARFSAGLGVFLVFLAATLIVFGGDVVSRFGSVAATLGYVPMPFLLLASMLWGNAGGSLATLVGGLLVIALTAAGGGPFAIADSFVGEAVVEVQAYVAMWAFLVLFVRALSESRRGVVVLFVQNLAVPPRSPF